MGIVGLALVIGGVVGLQRLNGESGIADAPPVTSPPKMVAGNPPPAPAPAALPMAPSPQVVPLKPNTRIEDMGGGFVKVAQGAARFHVTEPTSPLRVLAGSVVVEHVGTVFSVELLEKDRVLVAVYEGRVRVRWPSGTSELAAGDHGWFPPAGENAAPGRPVRAQIPERPSSSTPSPLVPVVPAPSADSSRPANDSPTPSVDSPMPSADSRWPVSPRDVPSDRSVSAPEDAPKPAPEKHDGLESLLRAADASRLAGYPTRALELLRRAADEHAGDPRAPLVAFTMGRLLLEELDRPVEAAQAFARAGAGAPSLAEDALAREVESWSRAGVPARARMLAEEYLARYPNGRRAAAVRRFGALP